jgi:hypothetical protein
MGFYEFKEDDILHVVMETHPAYNTQANGQDDGDLQITGSIYLEKRFLNDDLEGRTFFGFSEKLGGLIEKTGPFTSSLEFLTTTQDTTNLQLYESIIELYNYYAIVDSDYNANWNNVQATTFRVVSIPEIYYDRGVLSGSLTASDYDSAGDQRLLYDNGRGGIYSGSVTGSIVGNIFYSEGLIALKKTDLSDFGESGGSENQYWNFDFKGIHKIPVKIFKCRAPSGELNASTNETFYDVLTASSDVTKNERTPIFDEKFTYITAIGLYNEEYELVGLAKLAQPIKKEEKENLLFRLKMDF